MRRGGVESGCPIGNFLSREQEEKLMEVGERVEEFYCVVGGKRDETLAQLLHDVRGDKFSVVPQSEKPKLEGTSLRVAA